MNEKFSMPIGQDRGTCVAKEFHLICVDDSVHRVIETVTAVVVAGWNLHCGLLVGELRTAGWLESLADLRAESPIVTVAILPAHMDSRELYKQGVIESATVVVIWNLFNAGP